MNTTEQRTADVILQNPQHIKIGRRTYTVAPPSAATLILSSAAISRLPRTTLDSENPFAETLRIGKDTAPIGEAIAVLILGARHSSSCGLLHLIWRIRLRRLAARLLETHTPHELRIAATTLYANADIADFFGLTAFLVEVNMTKPTSKAVTTASGQQ